jgi:hypothetical protein
MEDEHCFKTRLAITHYVRTTCKGPVHIGKDLTKIRAHFQRQRLLHPQTYRGEDRRGENNVLLSGMEVMKKE